MGQKTENNKGTNKQKFIGTDNSMLVTIGKGRCGEGSKGDEIYGERRRMKLGGEYIMQYTDGVL